MGVLVEEDEAYRWSPACWAGIDVDGGPTEEQLTVLGSIVSHLLPPSDLELDDITPRSRPAMSPRSLVRPRGRLRFCEMLMTLELCRHPQSAEQVARVEEYVSAMGVDDIELETTRAAIERGADEASKDLERFYGEILPEISEVSLRDNYLRLSEPDHALASTPAVAT